MKTTIAIILILVLGGAGFYYYNNIYTKNESSDLWNLVPQHALMVYESSNTAENFNNILSKKTGKALLSIKEIKSFNNTLQGLDSINSEGGDLGELLKGKLLMSVHVISKNKLGVTYYKNLDSDDQKKRFTKIIDHFKEKSNYTLGTRRYQNKEIYELEDKSTSQVLSYYIEKNTLVLSQVPFLVEDVIRLIDGEGVSFKAKNEALFKLPKLGKDEGNVYLNTNKVAQAIKIFGNFDNTPKLNRSLGSASFLDFRVEDKGLFFNGFTEYSNDDFLQSFKGQKPAETNLKYFVPNNASFLLEFAFDQPKLFFRKLTDYQNSSKSVDENKRRAFYKQHDLNNELGADWIGNNIGLVNLDGDQNQLIYLKTKDINEALNELNTLGEAVALAEGDSAYVERYSTYEIRELNAHNYPKYVFMPYMADMEESYYTAVENYVIFSNSILNLKELLNSIENENTWGRSVNYNSFLDRTLQESNISLVINTEKYLNIKKDQLYSNWKSFVSENTSTLHNFNLVSFQLSNLEANFYTSLIFEFNKKKEVIAENFDPVQQVNFNHKITTKPFVVKNHISNLREVVVQDSTNRIHLISNDGKELWVKTLDGPIIDELEQVDYYNNNKLQFFFTTSNAIHIIDRNGNYVEGFPKELKESVAYSKVIDYDNSKNYRFLTADDRGKIYLYNKTGRLLDGWGPLVLPSPLTSTPFHIRVRKKDCFVFVMSDGKILLLNRQGKPLSGFPIDLETRLATGVNVKIGSDFKSTIYSTISRDGHLTKFDMNGQIIETKQLYKPTKDSEFKILSDALGKSFVIVRKDLNRLVILDENANEILAKDYFESEGMFVQFYDFSTSNKLFAVTDQVQGFTYLYNNKGTLINSQPINSGFEVGIIYSEVRDDLKVYSVSDRIFQLLQFK